MSNFQLFVTDDMLDTIAECTNDKAQSTDANFVTTRQELVAFIGVSILIEECKGCREHIFIGVSILIGECKGCGEHNNILDIW